MGLYEKRILKKFQAVFNSTSSQKLSSIGGLGFKIEDDWDAISKEFQTRDPSVDRFTIDVLERYFENAFINPVTTALTSVSADEMGKSALKQALKTIRFTTDGSNVGSEECYKFNDAILVVNMSMAIDTSQSDHMGNYLTKMLEKSL